MKEKMKKVDREQAFLEVEAFLKVHAPKDFRRGKMTREKILEDYIDCIEAVEDGFLVFENNKPNYTFRTPLYPNAAQQEELDKQCTFRSRIKGADKTMLLDGIDPKKDLGKYMIKVISYITQLDARRVKELEKDDYEVLNQLCSVF